MAAAMLLSPLSVSTAHELVGSLSGLHPTSSFRANSSNFFLFTNPITRRRRPLSARYTIYASSTKSLDHIPKRFREENLDPALMENFKNVPEHLYGLPPSQLEMFKTGNFQRLAESAAEENLSSKQFCMKDGGISFSGTKRMKARFSLSSDTDGEENTTRSTVKPRDLPSLLLDARIVFLGMPIVAPVSQLIIAQIMYLAYDDSSKPIFLYINCSGTLNEKNEIVGSETDAYAIADTMVSCKSRVHTLNLTMAYGQAAMLLSVGAPGHRVVFPNSFTKLHMPRVFKSNGNASDMWTLAKDINANADSYLDLLAKGTGKDKEQIAKDLQRSMFFGAQGTIDYGLADRMVDPTESFSKNFSVPRDYKAMAAEARAKKIARSRAASRFRKMQ